MRPVHHILCPLAIEARALRPLQQVARVEVICTGPGPERMRAHVEAVQGEGMLLLAGLATALIPDLPGGSTCWVKSIHQLNETPTVWPPPGINGVVACQVQDVLPDQPCRAAVGRATGAAVANLECDTFARSAIATGRPWGLMLGISDGLDSVLPPVQDWVDAQGRTRVAAALGWLALHPIHLGRLRTLGRDTSRALRTLRGLLEQVLDGC